LVETLDRPDDANSPERKRPEAIRQRLKQPGDGLVAVLGTRLERRLQSFVTDLQDVR
jgi:hypothetical protein